MLEIHSHQVSSLPLLQAISGQVFDRHLLGLKLVAVENGLEIPELYNDPTYAKSVHFCLSTSQVCIKYLAVVTSASSPRYRYFS